MVGESDPFMMIISIEQLTNNYFVEAFPHFVTNYVTVCMFVSSGFFQNDSGGMYHIVSVNTVQLPCTVYSGLS